MRIRTLAQIWVLVAAAIVLSGCCGEIKTGKETVDVSPLYELELHLDDVEKLSNLMDASIFDNAWTERDDAFNGEFYGNGTITVLMFLYDNSKEAIAEFQAECEYIPQATYGGSGTNQYCFSSVTEMRSSPESLCQPTGTYVSDVVFLKDRLTISLTRYTGDVKSPELEEAILKIAKAVNP